MLHSSVVERLVLLPYSKKTNGSSPKTHTVNTYIMSIETTRNLTSDLKAPATPCVDHHTLKKKKKKNLTHIYIVLFQTAFTTVYQIEIFCSYS